MTVLNEGRHPGEFLISEAQGQRSRGNITVASGAGVIVPGAVLGKVTATGQYLASSNTADDGSEASVAVALYGCDATDAAADIAAIVRDAEINGSVLTYHADRDEVAEKAAANAQLEAAGIIVR